MLSSSPLTEYQQNLKKGKVFARNDYGESIVISAELSESPESLLVLCENPEGFKGWSLARVSIDDHLFIHESLGTFFTLEGAEKEFTLARGIEWEGGDTFDDYC